MATSSGTVTNFDGAGGLLAALLAFIVGTETTGEVIGSGNGSDTVFSFTLDNTPASPGQVEVRYTISGVEKTAKDNGGGVITGPNISTGSITYTTGAGSITLDTPADDLTSLFADYIAGTAGQDWKKVLDRKTRNNLGAEIWPSGDQKEVILQNTGASGAEKVIVGIREWEYMSLAAYGWNLNCYLFYGGGDWNENASQHQRSDYGDEWNTWKEHPALPLIDDTIAYWIYSSKGRIIVVAKVNNRYESAYLGLARRFGAPSQYPYPLCAIGSIFGELAASDDSDAHRFIAGPGRMSPNNYGAFVVDPGGVYRFPGDLYWLPYHDFQTIQLEVPGKTSNSKVPLLPVYVMSDTAGETYFDLDGVFCLATANMQGEDVLEDGGDNYRVFQDVFRSDYYRFMAIKEV